MSWQSAVVNIICEFLKFIDPEASDFKSSKFVVLRSHIMGYGEALVILAVKANQWLGFFEDK